MHAMMLWYNIEFWIRTSIFLFVGISNFSSNIIFDDTDIMNIIFDDADVSNIIFDDADMMNMNNV